MSGVLGCGVVALTHSRGATPTWDPDSIFGHTRDRKPIMTAMLVACMLHLPMLPSALSRFLLAGLAQTDDHSQPLDGEVMMPVELDVGMLDGSVPPPVATAATRMPLSGNELALLPTASPPLAKAPKPRATPPPATPASAEAPEPDAPRPKIEDPRHLAGGAGVVGAKHPNVRIYLAMDVIRRHPLAPRFGELLQEVPQWRVLLGGSGIDPMLHFDHMSLSGPHLRSPRVVVAVADFNISVTRMQNAIDAVVRGSKTKGRWLPGSVRRPVAIIGDEGEHRVHVLRKQRLIAIVPSQAAISRKNIESLRPFRPSSRVAAGIFVKTPWRAFRRLRGFAFPKRIQWLRVRITPLAGGAFLLEADGRDVSKKAALADAALLEDQIRVFQAAMLFFRNRYFDDPVFDVEDSTIRMKVRLSPVQARRVLDRVAQQLQKPGRSP
jgi:hypothetical protein